MHAGVSLLSGCVAASLAEEEALRHHDGEASRAREGAEKALRDALALDPGLREARLRLGKLLLDVRLERVKGDVPARPGYWRGAR